MSPRPDVSEERRAQIIESAIKVFSEKGFARTRMDDVATEAGLSKGLLYWYFKSKEEIIIAISDVLFSGEIKQMKNVSDGDAPAPQRLKNLLDFFNEDVQGMVRLYPVILEFYSLAFRNQTVRTVLKRYMYSTISILESIIQQGMADGDFISGDVRQICLFIGGALEGTLLLYAYDPDNIDLDSQLKTTMSSILKSLEVQS